MVEIKMIINKKIIETFIVFLSSPVLLEPLSFSRIFLDVIDIVLLKRMFTIKTFKAKIPTPPKRIKINIKNCPKSLHVSAVTFVVNPVSLKEEAAVNKASIKETSTFSC